MLEIDTVYKLKEAGALRFILKKSLFRLEDHEVFFFPWKKVLKLKVNGEFCFKQR